MIASMPPTSQDNHRGVSNPATVGGAQIPLRVGPSKFRADFPAWLMDNQHIWLAFCRQAQAVWDRGRRHYSARTIVEVLRHESALSDSGETFKLNGNFAPDLARLYAETYPERASLFETRRQAGSARAA